MLLPLYWKVRNFEGKNVKDRKSVQKLYRAFPKPTNNYQNFRNCSIQKSERKFPQNKSKQKALCILGGHMSELDNHDSKNFLSQDIC